jgi:ammonium transporter
VYGGTGFFMIQLAVVFGASVYAFILTYMMLVATDFITHVKVSEDDENLGLDRSIHGETSYDIGFL